MKIWPFLVYIIRGQNVSTCLIHVIVPTRGKHGEENQVAELPLADPVVIGATHPKVSQLARVVKPALVFLPALSFWNPSGSDFQLNFFSLFSIQSLIEKFKIEFRLRLQPNKPRLRNTAGSYFYVSYPWFLFLFCFLRSTQIFTNCLQLVGIHRSARWFCTAWPKDIICSVAGRWAACGWATSLAASLSTRLSTSRGVRRPQSSASSSRPGSTDTWPPSPASSCHQSTGKQCPHHNWLPFCFLAGFRLNLDMGGGDNLTLKP